MDFKNLFSIEGKTALVTGGSRGIGEMIAAGFLANGAKVYITSRKAEVCDATAKRLSDDYGGECISLPANLADLGGIDLLTDQLKEREQKLHILVNNAGVSWGASLEEFPENGWDKVFDTNVKGVFFLTQRLLPLLEAAGTAEDPARVINIGSIDGLRVPALETYSYSASKAAVHQLTRHLARRLAPTVTVNAIAPGPFESRMMAATLRDFGEEIAAAAPMKRIGRAEDMAGAAIYLASPAASYVTGVVLPVDGGIATLA